MAEKVVGIPVAELAHAQLLAFEVLRRMSLAQYSTPGQLRWMVSTIESSVIFGQVAIYCRLLPPIL